MRAVRQVAMVTAVSLAVGPAAFGLDKGKAAYMGGTITTIKDQTEGQIDLKNEERLIFRPKSGSPLEIPWASISEMEYGQKAGRRVVMAVVLSPFALFSKNRKHYVTFSWKDAEDKDQAAVLQFDKNDIRPALAIMKARTGKELTFQDEEAQKQMGGAPAEKK
jgi:hypothetical protein